MVRPPSTLGEAGRRLWNEVQREFNVEDVCGRELLAQACGAADRVESLRTQIAIDGETIRTKTGMRAHPLLMPELGVGAFITKTLIRLGINFEPLRSSVGRPAGRGA